MVTSRRIVDPRPAGPVEEEPFPDLSAQETRALLDSLEEAQRQISEGAYRMFDAEAILGDLKRKHSSS